MPLIHSEICEECEGITCSTYRSCKSKARRGSVTVSVKETDSKNEQK